MSSIAVNQITDANAGNTATINAVTPNTSNVVGKNRIIGGDFTTNPWQRGTSFAAIAHPSYSADRWRAAYVTSAVVTASKAADAPTASQAGVFTQDCLSLAVTTADTSIAASDFFLIGQFIEGLNAASFGFGQAGSRNVTLSFWVKGTKTGIHCVSIANSAANRSYVAEYTIVASNTWEYKTITIPVDTSGTWLYDTGIGVRLNFMLMAGTTYHTTANTWTAGTYTATANQVNALDSTANTFKIALVQLEAGSSATEFEHRPYGTELSLCQRYLPAFVSSSTNSTLPGIAAALGTNVNFIFNHPVPARVKGTGVTVSGATHFNFSNNDGNTSSTAVSFGAGSSNATQVVITVAVSRGGSTTPGWIYSNTASGLLLITGCEL